MRIKEKSRKPRMKRDFNANHRRAFFMVVETYNELRSTSGSPKSMDYFQSTLGSAKYKNDISFLRLLDFTFDVDKAVVDTLDAGDLVMFREKYKDQGDQSANSSLEEMAMQAKLGQVFMARKLYPVSSYFMVSK